MPLNPMNHHYAMENPASIYDEEAMTALELAGRTTAKVNETVRAFNQLEANVPGMVDKQVIEHIKSGEFDKAISLYIGDLESRVDNLLSSYVPGSTTLDGELIDMRIGPDGTKYASAGEALRHYLNLGGLVEDNNYKTKMPDANQVLTPSAYILHFASGTKDIPAGLPFEKWHGRIATFITLPGSYYRQVLITDNAIYTRNGTRPTNWAPWRSLGKPTYIIDINGGGDFASILKALSTYNTNARFIIKKGVYDISLEYTNVYGPTYFENYVGYRDSQDIMDRGLFLGDGVELIGEGRVELVFAYTGKNDNVRKYFSVLNTSQNNTVKNVDITIVDGSSRYIIHDDFANDGGTNIFKNMTLTGHAYLGTAIGGGFGIYNSYIIEDCTFKDPQMGIAIAYHNNAGDGKNKLSISGCWCDGSIYIKHYGTSAQKSIAEVFNCRASKITLTHGDIDAYPNENIKLTTWNNESGSALHITPQMYGAIGDGVADDTEAFQAMFNAPGPLEIWIPAGEYRITKKITNASSAHIKCSKSAVIVSEVENDICLYLTHTTHTEGLTLKGVDEVPGQRGILLSGNSSLVNATISHFEEGVVVSACYSGKLDSSYIENNTVGVRFDGFLWNGVASTGCTISNTIFVHNDRAIYSTYQDDVRLGHVFGCTFHYCTSGLYLDSFDGIIEKCWFESLTGYGIYANNCRIEENTNSYASSVAVPIEDVQSSSAMVSSGRGYTSIDPLNVKTRYLGVTGPGGRSQDTTPITFTNEGGKLKVNGSTGALNFMLMDGMQGKATVCRYNMAYSGGATFDANGSGYTFEKLDTGKYHVKLNTTMYPRAILATLETPGSYSSPGSISFRGDRLECYGINTGSPGNYPAWNNIDGVVIVCVDAEGNPVDRSFNLLVIADGAIN